MILANQYIDCTSQYNTDEEGREEMHFLPINVFKVITHSCDIKDKTFRISF